MQGKYQVRMYNGREEEVIVVLSIVGSETNRAEGY
jgi:hypothetical protein